MDWYVILFIVKWAAIGIFYSILLLLLFGVYRETSRKVLAQIPATPAPVGQLLVKGTGDDRRIPLGAVFNLKPETRLGAERDNDLVLRDSYVSGYHASLRWDGKSWWIEDLNSKNGTKVNYKACPPRTPHPVPMGSIISIGDMVLELVAQGGR